MKRNICLVGIISCICISAVGFGDELLGGFGASWGMVGGMGNSQMNMMNPMDPDQDGIFSLSENWVIDDDPQGENCTINLNLSYKEDPWVQGGFSVTNNATFNQMFSFSFTSPVVPDLTGPTEYMGSMSGSFSLDDPVNGATGTVSTMMGTSLFEGFVNGSATPLLTFHDSGSWSADNVLSGGTGSETIPAGNLGWTAGPSPVSGELEIVFTFLLTPGETATMNGRMEIVEVPEPATMALLALGGLMLRRKK